MMENQAYADQLKREWEERQEKVDKILTPYQKRLNALNPLVRGYLSLEKMSLSPELTDETRERVESDRAEALGQINVIPGLKAELINFQQFQLSEKGVSESGGKI